jgi:hypothetical protein
MDYEIARKIGRYSALKFVSVGLFKAYFIMAILISGDGIYKAIFWITEVDTSFTLTIIVSIVTTYIVGYLFGGLAGIDIIIKNKNPFLIGIMYSFITVITSTFYTSLVGFFRATIVNQTKNENLMSDYVFKPIFIITVFGCVPIVIIGFLFGNQIKRKALKQGLFSN